MLAEDEMVHFVLDFSAVNFWLCEGKNNPRYRSVKVVVKWKWPNFGTQLPDITNTTCLTVLFGPG